MRRKFITDAEVEKEIDELSESPFVALARREQRLKNKYRQKLYQLRSLDKRGRELAAIGITIDTIDEQLEMLEETQEQA